MTDPADNERERIKNISEPQGFTFFAEPTPPGQRYLGDPEDVEATVRDFCLAVYELRGAVGEGKVTGPVALSRLEDLANRYAGIFFGREPADFRTMPFNAPDGVGEFIKRRMGLEEPPEQAGYVLFMNTANQILEAYEGHQSGAMDEETVKFRLDAAVEDAKGMLLGLPLEE